MSWVKRNLYFLIGSFVALVMMGAAGWFLYSKWQLNNEMLDKLNGEYEELRRLGSQSPHPGSGDVDNIKAAKDQQQRGNETSHAAAGQRQCPALHKAHHGEGQHYALQP